ncbi:aldo/keto reductase [Methanobacterium sp.]|uniref:aldo/keto reductase n=1 Tax=Methanobacterium sp. TaxID=2164 RepID=UPI003C7072B4
MLYRKIRNDKLSVLGFGAMRLPSKNGRTDEKRAKEQIRYAIDNGVNYIDTAVAYMNEPLIGRILSDGYREKVKIATKLPPWNIENMEDMANIFKIQLESFRTDYIDYYLLHGLNHSSWEKMRKLGALEFLTKLKNEGKILNAGFSFHGDKKTFKEIVDSYDWDFCMIQYNYLDEENQAGKEGLKYAANKGIGIIVMEPFRGGNLTKNIPPEVKNIWNQAKIKRTPAEWALRWVLNHPEVTCVLSGMNEEEHITENIRIANEALPNSLQNEELELIEKVKDKYRDLMKTGCTGCRYCLPCPAGVEIARCFEFYDTAHTFGNKRQTQLLYALGLGVIHEGTPAYASKCKKCGKCENHCPQDLPIMDLLDEVSKDMEGILTKTIPPLYKVYLSFNKIMTRRKANKLDSNN